MLLSISFFLITNAGATLERVGYSEATASKICFIVGES